MKKIKIRSNITTDLVMRHLKRVANDEEKERQERAKNYNNTNPFYTGYNGPRIYIYFYEWSNIMHAPIQFTEYREFFKFCSDSCIPLTDEIRQKLYGMSYMYLTCKDNSTDLLIAQTYMELWKMVNGQEPSQAAKQLSLPAKI